MRQKKSKQTDETANQQSLDIRTGLSTEAIKQAILDNLQFAQARVPELATQNDLYMSVAFTIRYRLPGPCEQSFQGQTQLDTHIDPEHRPHGQVLLRPLDTGILR